MSGVIIQNTGGNLGIGTTMPVTTLDVRGNSGVVGPQLNVQDTVNYNASPMARIDFAGQYNAGGARAGFAAVKGGKENTFNGNVAGYLGLWTYRNGDPDVTERVRIDSSGNVGIGTPSPAYKLDVNGHAMIRGTLGISGGDNRIEAVWGDDRYHPYLALTAADYYTVLKPSSGGFRVTNYQNTGNPPWYGNNLILNNDPDTLTGNQLFLPRGKLAEGSDSRLKLNQEPLDYGLGEVLALQPKRYVRAELSLTLQTVGQESQEEESGSEIGLIAQEVYEVIPEAVAPPDEVRATWCLSYSSLVPVLVNAIQEQQEMIEKQKEINVAQEVKIISLEERIAALEQK